MGLGSKFVDGATGGDSDAGSIIKTALEAGLRFLQFVFAIAVIGLYGQDLRYAMQEDVAADPKWVCSLSTPSPRKSNSSN